MLKINSYTPLIGIVGGVGPYAGLDLVQKVFDQTQAQSDQEHLPVAMLSLSERILDRTEYLEGSISENPAYEMAKVLLKLEQIGAVVAGIPCNTAHAPAIFELITDQLTQAGSKLQLYHLIKEAVLFIKRQYTNMQKIGVLSTTGTWRLGLYTDMLKKYGLTALAPPEDMQTSLVHPAIYDKTYGIKAQSEPVSQQAKDQLLQAMRALKSEGAQCIILGCTELPLAFRESEIEGLKLIDPTRILARKLIEAVAAEKLCEWA